MPKSGIVYSTVGRSLVRVVTRRGNTICEGYGRTLADALACCGARVAAEFGDEHAEAFRVQARRDAGRLS